MLAKERYDTSQVVGGNVGVGYEGYSLEREDPDFSLSRSPSPSPS